jgi:hypothetical protein
MNTQERIEFYSWLLTQSAPSLFVNEPKASRDVMAPLRLLAKDPPMPPPHFVVHYLGDPGKQCPAASIAPGYASSIPEYVTCEACLNLLYPVKMMEYPTPDPTVSFDGLPVHSARHLKACMGFDLQLPKDYIENPEIVTCPRCLELIAAQAKRLLDVVGSVPEANPVVHATDDLTPKTPEPPPDAARFKWREFL